MSFTWPWMLLLFILVPVLIAIYLLVLRGTRMDAVKDAARTFVNAELRGMRFGIVAFSGAAIILLSDGQSNQGPDALDAAEKAANLGVRVFTVGVGTQKGADINLNGFTFHAILDEPTLRKIALITRGSYFKASSAEELRSIYQSTDFCRCCRVHQEQDRAADYLSGDGERLAAFLLVRKAERNPAETFTGDPRGLNGSLQPAHQARHCLSAAAENRSVHAFKHLSQPVSHNFAVRRHFLKASIGGKHGVVMRNEGRGHPERLQIGGNRFDARRQNRVEAFLARSRQEMELIFLFQAAHTTYAKRPAHRIAFPKDD